MTYEQAVQAKRDHTLVCLGDPGTEDYDEGYIIDLETEATAFVAWNSGVRTPAAVADLAPVTRLLGFVPELRTEIRAAKRERNTAPPYRYWLRHAF